MLVAKPAAINLRATAFCVILFVFATRSIDLQFDKEQRLSEVIWSKVAHVGATKDQGKNQIKFRPLVVHHLLRYCLLLSLLTFKTTFESGLP